MEVKNVIPGDYSVTETTFDDWIIEAIELSDDDSTYNIANDGRTGTVTFRVGFGEIVRARFKNTRPNVQLNITAGPGGRVTYPGEGWFEYCSSSEVCLDAEAQDANFVFVGWRGSYFRDVVNTCPSPIVKGNLRLCGETRFGNYLLSCDGCNNLQLKHDHDIHAVFMSRLDTLYVDDNAANDPCPHNPLEGDHQENGTADHPFDSIQEAIDVATPGATVMVAPGTYRENLRFHGRPITVTGVLADGNEAFPIITARHQDMAVVTFGEGEELDTILRGFVITGGFGVHVGGVLCQDSSPTLENCAIVGNRVQSINGQGGAVQCINSHAVFKNCTVQGNYGGHDGAAFYCDESNIVVINSILYDNQPREIMHTGAAMSVVAYSNVAGGYDGEENLNTDPHFVRLGTWKQGPLPSVEPSPSDPYAVWHMGDYHLHADSPSIDAGDPNDVWTDEPGYNGGRINQGVYGGTSQATESPEPADPNE
jgi:hypothetical protein